MSTQEERYQTVLIQLHGDIAELKNSAHTLREENHVLRAQVYFFCFQCCQVSHFSLFLGDGAAFVSHDG